jgi:PAS domain S-box-containing protein
MAMRTSDPAPHGGETVRQTGTRVSGPARIASSGPAGSITAPDAGPRDADGPHVWSIRTILAALVIAVLLPVAVFAAFLVQSYTQRERQQAARDAITYADQIRIDVERQFQAITAVLNALASSPALQRRDFETFHRQAEGVTELIDIPVVLRDLEGQHLVNTRVPWGGQLPKRYQPAIDDVIKANPKPFLSDLFMGTLAGKEIFNLVTPVFIDGVLTGTLSTSIEPERLSAIIAAQALPPGWIANIVDRQNRVVARSAELNTYVGHAAFLPNPEGGERKAVRLVGPDGLAYLKGHVRTAQGWTVSAFTPVDTVEAPLRRAWNGFLVAGAAGLIIALVLARTISTRISRPLAEVAGRAEGLIRGAPVPLVSSPVLEINQVSEAMTNASRALRERQRELLESESRYRALFEQAAVGFEHVTLGGEWLGVNGQLRKMLGYERDDIISLTPADLTPPEDRVAEHGLIEQLIRGEIPSYAIDKRYQKKDGSYVWVRATSSLAREHNGEPAYRISVIEDVTERRRANANSARLAALVQSSPDAIISLSLDGIVETWNPGAEDLFGWSALDIVGQSYRILELKSLTHPARHILPRVALGESCREELVARHKDGSILDIAVSAAPIRTSKGKIVAVSKMIENIAERKRWERQLALLNRELQHRVRNTLAVVQSVANQSMKDNPTPEAFRLAFQGRLQSLAAASEILTQSNWSGAEFSGFIARQLEPLVPRRESQLHLDGPSLVLPSSLTVPIGLCLHELGTNALKYGAWTRDDGQVHIRWRVTEGVQGDGRRLQVDWTEQGGPKVVPPSRAGFGTILVERGIPGSTVTRRFDPDGLICRIEVDLPAE